MYKKSRSQKHFILLLLSTFAISFFGSNVFSSDKKNKTVNYEVTVTNLTRGQSFTPLLVATHDRSISLFKAGTPSTNELGILAEGGNIQPLSDLLFDTGRVKDIQTNGALLDPGKTVMIKVKASSRARFLSVVAMLIPTNDAFVSLNRVPLPLYAKTYTAIAYDAGTEPNDEKCVNIPGPVCGGEGHSPNRNGEGFVHVHAGIHGIGDLQASEYDWRNPVAKITVKRVK